LLGPCSRETVDRAADGSADGHRDRRIGDDDDAAIRVQGVQQSNETDGRKRRNCD
jgi:hypothetical protein